MLTKYMSLLSAEVLLLNWLSCKASQDMICRRGWELWQEGCELLPAEPWCCFWHCQCTCKFSWVIHFLPFRQECYLFLLCYLIMRHNLSLHERWEPSTKCTLNPRHCWGSNPKSYSSACHLWEHWKAVTCSSGSHSWIDARFQ